MPPVPSNSRISSCGKAAANSCGVNGVNPELYAAVGGENGIGAEGASMATLSKQRGHWPCGDPGGMSLPQIGQRDTSVLARPSAVLPGGCDGLELRTIKSTMAAATMKPRRSRRPNANR